MIFLLRHIENLMRNSESMQHIIMHNFLKLTSTLASKRSGKSKLLILSYHRVLKSSDHLFPEIVDVESFENHLEVLTNYFNVIPLHEAIKLMAVGKLPCRAVSITFDDGYRDNVDNALPLLKKWGVTATFFISTGFFKTKKKWKDIVIEAKRNTTKHMIDLSEFDLPILQLSTCTEKYSAIGHILPKIKNKKPNERLIISKSIASKLGSNISVELMMDESGVITLAENGMDIGGHTVTHPILSSLEAGESMAEIHDGIGVLEKIINNKISLFAYPNGRPDFDYNLEHVETLKKAGIQAAVSTAWGYADKSNDLFQLPRMGVTDKGKLKFHARLAKSYFDKQKDFAWQ